MLENSYKYTKILQNVCNNDFFFRNGGGQGVGNKGKKLVLSTEKLLFVVSPIEI